MTEILRGGPSDWQRANFVAETHPDMMREAEKETKNRECGLIIYNDAAAVLIRGSFSLNPTFPVT